MNLLDKAIGAVAPSWGLKRAQARAALDVADRISKRRYEGADRGRRTQGWAVTGAGPNQELRPSLRMLRTRCRALKENNAHAKSAQGILRGNLAGRGIRPKFRSDSDATVRMVAELWEEWASRKTVDVQGRLSWYSMQGALSESMVEGGEAIVRRRRRRPGDGLLVPLQLQVMESDWIDDTRDLSPPPRRGGATGNFVVQGVEFDRLGRPRGAWLYDQHPGEVLLPGRGIESRFVRDADLTRIYRVDRLGQVRGVPWGAPVILRLHDYDAYEDNEQLRMVAATAFAGFVRDISIDASFTDGVQPIAGGETQENALGQPTDEVEAGTIEYLPEGKDITFTSPPQNEGFPAFAQVQLRAVARGYGVPYWQMTGDTSGLNFSTARASLVAWNRELEQWRQETLVDHFCEPTMGWWVDQASLSLLIPEATDIGWTWIPPRREMIDPRTEVNAEVTLVRAGFKSLSQVVAELGMDSRRVLEQLQKDLSDAEELGLVLSIDGSQVQVPGSATSTNRDGGSSGGGGGESSSRAWDQLESRLSELYERELVRGDSGEEIPRPVANGRH